jgi:hypothetical protein
VPSKGSISLKKRLTVPKAVEKRAFQQTNSRCAFCPEHEVSSLQLHHIDGNPGESSLPNLLVVCASCHTKITAGVLSEADVLTKKREVEWTHDQRTSPPPQAAVHVTISGSNFRGDIAQNLTRIVSPRAPRIMHPPSSLGADLEKRGYIDYLIKRYYEYRKADRSFRDRRHFNHAQIHLAIQDQFGHKTFFMPTGRFDELAGYLQHRIDNTILGRRNVSRGVANYHPPESHGT